VSESLNYWAFDSFAQSFKAKAWPLPTKELKAVAAWGSLSSFGSSNSFSSSSSFGSFSSFG